MIVSSKKWITTPAICNTCGKKYQMVFEADILTIDGMEEIKLPDDLYCKECGGDDFECRF